MSEKVEARLLVQLVGSDAPPAELPRAGMLVIGSSREKAGLVVEGQGVAEVHCAVGRTTRGGWALKDLGSDYGTFLNGERITQARLRAGDQILIGSRRLKVFDPERARAEPSASAPPAPAPPAARAAASEPAAAPSAPLPEVPGYRVVRLLGRGAMGAVYLAVQESLDREVALKVLPPRLARDEDFVRRFQAEARAAAALNHPNVVTVHDVGQSDGRHYLTMEYMDRGSLEERVAKEGKLDWRQVLAVLHDAASGLVYAESRGIVHRDIKPANLMQNHTGATKIADLGLATQVEAESQEAEGGDRKIFGTPHFISPEQVRGVKADCRSDLYSLGATAYRLLSGHTPFEGASSRDILRAKLREDPRPLREFVSDLPADVEALVVRAMQREPEARHPSASALLREVDALRASAAGTAAAPLVVVKKRGLSYKLALGILVVVGGVFALTRSQREAASDGTRGTPIDGGTVTNGGGDVAGDPPDPDAGPGGAGSQPAPDDDAQEKIFELQAENAFLALDQRDLPPPERRDALRVLAEEYQGTTVASRALDEAASLEAELRLEQHRETERERELSTLFAALRAASGLDSGSAGVSTSDALRAMAAVAGQEAWEADASFRARRASLENEVLARQVEELERKLAELAQLERQGRFEDMRPGLVELLARTDLPEFPEGRTPVGAPRVLEIRRDVREKLSSLGELATRYVSERARDDARAVGRALRGSGAFEDELARLDLGAADARLAALEAELFTDASRAWVASLRSDLKAGAEALRAVAASYDAWRRKSIPDPRTGRSGIAEVRGAGAGGIVLDGSDGPEEVPWSAFGMQPSALHGLFYERLAREYTQDELRGIAALLRCSAVVAAVRDASEMLEPGSNAVLTERETRAIEKLFDDARDWARRAGTAAALDGERDAALALALALRRASEGAWTTAVSELERLLAEREGSLLVRLLADGSGLAADAPAAQAPPEPAPYEGEGAPPAGDAAAPGAGGGDDEDGAQSGNGNGGGGA